MSNNDYNQSNQAYAEELGKKALKEFFKDFLVDNTKHYYSPYYPPAESPKKYSALVHQKSQENNSVIKSMYFHAKIYEFYTDYLLLDKDVFEYLKSFFDQEPSMIMYFVCFTPKGTIVFNLTELWSRNKLRWEPSKKVQDKEVAVLKVTVGKLFSFIFKPTAATVSTPQPIKPQESYKNPLSTGKNPLKKDPPLPKNEPQYEEETPARDSFFMNANSIKRKGDKKEEAFPETEDTEMFKEEEDKIITPVRAYNDEDYGITRDDDDQIVIPPGTKFKDFPMFIQKEYADRYFLIKQIPDKDLRDAMIQEHGSLEALVKHIRKK